MSETEQKQPSPDYTTLGNVQTRHNSLLERVLENTVQAGFDPDAWHVMDQRDTRLIQDEIMGGPRSSKFIYNFSVSGSAVRGISAVGARELATHYGKIRHRLVSSTRKIGKLFVFTTYAHPGVQPSMQTQVLPELADEPDGYEAVCEVSDINSGNSMMAAKFESQFEWVQARNNGKGDWREKSHFATIAQSKAQRNGILMVIPQAIQLEWMESMKGMGKDDVITGSVLAEKRDGVLRYGAAQGLAINRDVLETLLLEQIAGLSEAARTKNQGDFLASAIALGLVPPIPEEPPTRESVKATGATKPARASRPAPVRASETRSDPRESTPSGPSDTERQATRQQSDIPDDRWGDAPGDAAPTQTTPPAGAVQSTDSAAVVQDAGGVPPSSASAPFEAWLVDGEGNELPDADGVIEAYTDPAAYVRAYLDALRNEFPGTVELFRQANAESVALAVSLSPEVAPLVAPKSPDADSDNPTLPMSMPTDPAVVFAPPAKPTKADMDAYKASLKAVYATSSTPDAFNHARDVNKPVYDKFPPSQRLACEALFEQRQKEMSAPPADSGEDLARGLLADVASFIEPAKIDAWRAYQPAIDELERLRKSSQHLYAVVIKAADDRKKVLMKAHYAALAAADPRTGREIFQALMTEMTACTSWPQIQALPSDPRYTTDVQVMHVKDPHLWPELQTFANKCKAAFGA